ncbi:periplasmic protein [Campylobacter coli]|nr:periplasmic protein [Campylobacter coli]
MKKVFPILISLCSLSLANVYEKLNDFAYEKKPNKDFKIQEVKLVQFLQDDKNCLELLIEAGQVRILKSYNECQKLSKDADFQKFLNEDFLRLYKNNGYSINENLQDLKRLCKIL